MGAHHYMGMLTSDLANRVGPNGASTRSLPLELHSPDVPLEPEVAAYIRDKLTAKLARLGSRVVGLVVHMKDSHNPKGGVDKVCHMEARLSGLEPVNVEELHHDLRTAVSVAADRLETTVHRHLQRVRTVRRSSGRRMRTKSLSY